MWALLTGGITGGVGVAIVLFRRLRRLSDDQRALLAERTDALDALEAMEGRVGELEERLDFAERLLADRHAKADPSIGAPPGPEPR